jgi:hypothetical protein
MSILKHATKANALAKLVPIVHELRVLRSQLSSERPPPNEAIITVLTRLIGDSGPADPTPNTAYTLPKELSPHQ